MKYVERKILNETYKFSFIKKKHIKKTMSH